MTFRPHHKYKNFFVLVILALLLIGGVLLYAQQPKEAKNSSLEMAYGMIIAGSFNSDKQKTDEEWK